MTGWGLYNALVAAFFSGFVLATLLLGWKVRALRRTLNELNASARIINDVTGRMSVLKGRINQSLGAQAT